MSFTHLHVCDLLFFLLEVKKICLIKSTEKIIMKDVHQQ